MAQPYDIVGYTYMGETYTPLGILEVYRASMGSQEFERVTYAYTDEDQAVYFLASHLGFNYDDQDSYDSSQFPKPIFRDQVEGSTVLVTASDVRAQQRQDQRLIDAILSLYSR